MTVTNDREYFGDPAGGDESAENWFFDLPQGAWERQEAKRRQLRERLLRQAGEVEAPPPRKDPFGTAPGRQGAERQEKRPRWSLFRRQHDDADDRQPSAFDAEDFEMGSPRYEPDPAATAHAEDRPYAETFGWEDASDAVGDGPPGEPATAWDAALQQTEDPLEAMRRWAQGASSMADEAPPSARDGRPAEWGGPSGAYNEATEAVRRWSRDLDEEANEPSFVHLDPVAQDPVMAEAEDEFEPWAKELLAADEEPPPHQPERRGLLGKLFGRSGNHEPDIDEVIAHAEAEGSWTPATDPGPRAVEREPVEPPEAGDDVPAAPPPIELPMDPWTEFLRAREQEQETAQPARAEPESLPFAEGSSTGESVDRSTLEVRVEEPNSESDDDRDGWQAWDFTRPDDAETGDGPPAPATPPPTAAMADEGRPADEEATPASAWEDWPAIEDEAPPSSAGDDELPAVHAQSASAWDGWDAGVAEPEPAAGATGEPLRAETAASSRDDQRETDLGAATGDAGEPAFAPLSTPDDVGARDDLWEAIAADQSDADVGVFLRSPGVLGGRRLHQQSLDNESDLNWPSADEADEPGEDAIVAKPVPAFGRDDQAWILEDDEEDIIVRAFEEHAATAVEEDQDGSPSADADVSLEELLGADVTPDASTDNDTWTPRRVVETDDALVANFMGDGNEDETADWHEEGPPWSRDTAMRPGEPHRSHGSRSKTLVRELIETGLLALLVFLAVRASFQNFRVEGESMFPTLHDGQYVIVNKLVYAEVDMGRLGDFVPIISAEEGEKRHVFHGAQRGDIVVFRSPRDPSEDLIKRVIALPGETIEILDGKVYVNDRLLEEPYITTAWHGNHPKILIPDDQYFVMGDNRNNSQDSRSPQVGLVHKDMIVGKVTLSYWPADRFGLGPGGGAKLTDELRPASIAAASATEQ